VLIRHLHYLGLALVAGAVGLAVVASLGGFSAVGFAQEDKGGAVVTVLAAGAAMAIVYLGLLTVVRSPELGAASTTIAARFRRSR
jgi:putative peptidoglycan lipid II flippase